MGQGRRLVDWKEVRRTAQAAVDQIGVKLDLYVLYRRAKQILDAAGIKVFHAYVGEFATSMEMAGASMSLLKLDGETKRLPAKPARTPFFQQEQL